MAAKPIESTPVADREFVITRVFNAPRARVWSAWTDAASLAQWWGPKGCKLKVISLDFRPGGVFHYAMDYSSGAGMWGRFVYRDIVAPERIVWVNSFSNAGGGIVHAPIAPGFPMEVLNTMTLTEENGATTLALRSTPLGATAEEAAFFLGMFSSMQQGFGGTFDQLEAFVTSKN